jgi:hypothetical protein
MRRTSIAAEPMDAEPVRQRIFNRVVEATSAFPRSGIGVLPTWNSEEPND